MSFIAFGCSGLVKVYEEPLSGVTAKLPRAAE
jgi:hypothetical protein